MENIFKSQCSDLKDQKNTISAKKTWVQPHVTEIPKFSILGGVEVGKAEGVTLDGSQ
jgi:hypothetical protein